MSRTRPLDQAVRRARSEALEALTERFAAVLGIDPEDISYSVADNQLCLDQRHAERVAVLLEQARTPATEPAEGNPR